MAMRGVLLTDQNQPRSYIMKFYVYELVVIPDGTVCYVGKGSGKRMFKHRANLKVTRYASAGLYRRLRDLLASGKNFEPRKVFETDDESAALAEEKRRILNYGIDNLFNSTTVQGLTMADVDTAHRQALSKARREYVARLQAETGHKMPQDVIDKMSRSRTGKVYTAEQRKHISDSLKGHTVKLSTRLKISQIQVGKPCVRTPARIAGYKSAAAKQTGKRHNEHTKQIIAQKISQFQQFYCQYPKVREKRRQASLLGVAARRQKAEQQKTGVLCRE
jgi:hypothetical protein